MKFLLLKKKERVLDGSFQTFTVSTLAARTFLEANEDFLSYGICRNSRWALSRGQGRKSQDFAQQKGARAPTFA